MHTYGCKSFESRLEFHFPNRVLKSIDIQLLFRQTNIKKESKKRFLVMMGHSIYGELK